MNIFGGDATMHLNAHNNGTVKKINKINESFDRRLDN